MERPSGPDLDGPWTRLVRRAQRYGLAIFLSGGIGLGDGGCTALSDSIGAVAAWKASKETEQRAVEEAEHRALVQQTISQLEQRQSALEGDIRALEEEKTRLEEVLKRHSERAERARCAAAQGEYRAVLAQERAGHIEERARWMQCAADLAKKHADQTAAGCLLGALVTGGVGLALCGGAALLKKKVTEVCGPEPPETMNLQRAMEHAMRRSKIDTLQGCDLPTVGRLAG